MNDPRNPSAKTLWQSAKAVCFDVDSTVIVDEGIDVLAAHLGAGAQVAELTASAMGGGVPFEVALRQRLDIIRPSRAAVADCLRRHPPRLTPGISELIHRLSGRGVHVYLVSGGFRQMIEPVAKAVGVPSERIYANLLRFNSDGSFNGHDPQQPTATSGGKAKVLAALKARFGYRPLVMVGDGATDLEARPPADLMIGFGGVVVREKVQQGADWFVTDFKELANAL
jgi:phosphoserine phosphatase